jgi:hypothetical protein
MVRHVQRVIIQTRLRGECCIHLAGGACSSLVLIALLLALPGCPGLDGGDNILSNTTDPTNGGADYLGALTCQACHPQLGALHERHGHSQILKRTQGTPPVYSSGLSRAGVPSPPPGLTFADLGFVIGGYTKGANFVDRDGFLLTDTASGLPIQYNLALPHTDSQAGFTAFTGLAATPYTFDCLRCHTTGPQSLAAGGLREDNRPGVGGSWALDGVQCEACHGPGSNHVPNPSAGNIYLDPRSATCTGCHSSGTGQILANEGFIAGNQQADELAASPHAGFTCTICHDPHASVFADRGAAIRNDCRACHASQNMALHQGVVYTQGNYTEPLTCESCHMSYAGRYVQSAAPERTAGLGRVGDTRTHIFFISKQEVDFTSMFTANGGAVVRDAQGKAAVTADFVCLRCHHGLGNAFALDLHGASGVTPAIHTTPP